MLRLNERSIFSLIFPFPMRYNSDTMKSPDLGELSKMVENVELP